jgi:hypothetical protein
MVDAPLTVIFEMVTMVLQNTVSTLFNLFGMMGNLSSSLFFIGNTGILGLSVAIIVMVVVLFFVGKFVLKSGKLIIILFIIGFLLLMVMFSGA